MMKFRKLFLLLTALAVVAAACGSAEPEATEAPATEAPVTQPPATEPPATEAPVVTEAPAPAVGSAENPIQVFFVPSTGAEEIIAGGELLDAALTDSTGLEFEVAVGSSYAATIEGMCAAPDTSMGFIPAQGYVLASDLCGVTIELKALRFGYDVYWTQFIVPRDSDIMTLADLEGKKWAYPDAGSTSGFLVPSGMFESLGITTGEGFEAGGHSAVARAIYNGEADFGTTFFSPVVDADFNSLWDGDINNGDVSADAIDTCALDADGQIACGDEYPRDARRGIRDEAPDVIQAVRIVTLSDPIPNDGVAFGPDFPADIQTTIVDALVAFAENDSEGFSAAFDAYSWSSVSATSDSEFDSIRSLLAALGFTMDDF
jgi:phosphonate transport system substrate-binding protein